MHEHYYDQVLMYLIIENHDICMNEQPMLFLLVMNKYLVEYKVSLIEAELLVQKQ